MKSSRSLKANNNLLMKRTMKYLIAPFLILLTIGFSSCEKVIEAKDLPQQDPMLVANSLVYADSAVRISVSSSKSILSGKDYKLIPQAVCDLFEDDVYLGSVNTNSNGLSVFPVIAKENKKYSIQVGASGYKTISASTMVPPKISITDIQRYDTTNSQYKFSDYSQGQGGKYLGGTGKFRFAIIDDITVKNYYKASPVVIVYDASGDSRLVQDTYISSNVTGLGDGALYSGALGIDDQTIVNGKEVQVDISVTFNYPVEVFMFDPVRVEVYLEVANLSQDYYKYQKTLNDQVSIGAGFFSEPVLVYTNIANGAGILAGANNRLLKIYPQ